VCVPVVGWGGRRVGGWVGGWGRGMDDASLNCLAELVECSYDELVMTHRLGFMTLGRGGNFA